MPRLLFPACETQADDECTTDGCALSALHLRSSKRSEMTAQDCVFFVQAHSWAVLSKQPLCQASARRNLPSTRGAMTFGKEPLYICQPEAIGHSLLLAFPAAQSEFRRGRCMLGGRLVSTRPVCLQ